MRRPLTYCLLLALTMALLVVGCGPGETSGDNSSGVDGGGTTARTVQSAEEAGLPDSISEGEIPQPQLRSRPVVIEGSEGEVRVEAEIATDDSTRARGLMARESLGEDEGMLFVFGSERPLRFIMENTLLPLSIAYIDSGGRIVDIQQMQPLSEESYPSAEPAQYALEVNQGFYEEHGVEVGDEADISRTEGRPR